VNQSADENEERCVGLKRAAAILNVCGRTIRREIERKKIRGFRVGRLWKFQMSELRRYIQDQSTGANNA
jgi:excisionase family DNA binding protein